MPEIAKQLQAPHSPRLFGAERAMTQSAVQKQMKQKWRVTPPRWCAVERSPEEEQQRRRKQRLRRCAVRLQQTTTSYERRRGAEMAAGRGGLIEVAGLRVPHAGDVGLDGTSG